MPDMPRIKSDVLRGNAEVRKAQKKDGTLVFRIVLDQVNKADKTVTKLTFNVEASKCPPYLKTGTWNLTVNADKDQVLSAIPDVANIRGEFHDIAHAEGKLPTPRVGQSSFDPTKPWITWTLLWKATEGEFKDMVLADFLNYNFDAFTLDDGRKVAAYKPAGGKATEALAQRIHALGVMDDKFGFIPWKGEEIPGTHLRNILPIIAARARKLVEETNRQVDIAIVGGKIIQVKLVVTDDELETEWAEGEEVIDNGNGTGTVVIDGTLVDVTESPKAETLLDDDETDWAE